METLKHFFTDARTIEDRCKGPIAHHIQRYAEHLHEQGYSRTTGRYQLGFLGDFSDWLERKHLSAAEVDSSTTTRYLRWRRRRRRYRGEDGLVLTRLLSLIHPRETNREPEVSTAIERVVQNYVRFLEQERGLSRATVVNYVPFARKLLTQRFPHDDIDFGRLSASDITEFVKQQAQQMGSSKRTLLVVTALRSFLRHLLHQGCLKMDLAACVPAVANWSLSNVPRFLAANEVQKVLDGCNRTTDVGRRNYAILHLLARLGLRAGEVVALTLEDIDWVAGLISIQGKGKRAAQLPLPTDVGEAIVEYLRQSRPSCASRRLFVRDRAPVVGFANSSAICSLVDRALEKAGVESVHRGSHLFRHSLATQMLNGGASLPEIGDLLRHRRPDTTAIYAKVDLASLRTIALAWPGGCR